jgi:hypothetical protein
MYMTQEDLHVFYHQIHQNVANKLGLEDFEWKSTNELTTEIQQSNSQVASIIKEFIEAYEAWFKVHEEIETSRSVGNLSSKESNNLTKAIEARDSTRKALINEINNL